MLVEWSEQALESLDIIIGYLADHNRLAAQQLHTDIMETATALSLFPYMHKLGRVAGTREAIVTANYFMVYRVTHCVEILEVLHTRREYP